MNKRNLGLALVLATLLAAALPSLSLASPSSPGEGDSTAGMAQTGSTPAQAHPTGSEAPRLSVEAPREAGLGDQVTLTARLVAADGSPVPGASIEFLTPGNWGPEIEGEIDLGEAKTDAAGVARLTFRAQRAGDLDVTARFEGDARFAPASAEAATQVTGHFQLFTIEMPEVSLAATRYGPWVLAAVLALVWGLYLYVARLVLRIAEAPDLQPLREALVVGPSRRRFVQTLVPMGMHAAIAPVGLGLITVIARSPYTHTNLEDHGPNSGYDRTPFAHVQDGEFDMGTLPPVLEREVSFKREVLPILLANAGPHAVPPRASPPPRGVLLDSYEHIMERQGLVVPGKPEQSELVSVLVNPAMRMPPSIPPLPGEQIQLIVSWVAQGARNT